MRLNRQPLSQPTTKSIPNSDRTAAATGARGFLVAFALHACAFAALLLPSGPTAVAAAPEPPQPAIDVASLAALDLAGGSVQSLAPSISPDGSLTLTLLLDGEPAEVSAVSRSLRAPGFTLVLSSGADGAETVVQPPPPATYRGTLVGRPGSVASLSVRDGAVRGMLRVESGGWGLQPLSEVVPGADPSLHVVYRLDQIVAPPHACGGALLPDGTEAPDGHGHGDEGGLAGDEPCNQLCQIAIDADVEYYQANGSSVENTVADIESIMDAVESIFLVDTGISYLITTIKVRTVEPDPYTSTSSGTLLNEFKSWWNTNEQGTVRDVAHLFTGKNLNGTTIGVAYLSTICSPTQAYGLTQSKWSTNFVLRTATTTHELGHNWSAPHCNADSACAIMCSSIAGCSGNVTFFEAGSKNTIIAYRDNASCLGPGPQAAPIAADDALYAAMDVTDVLDVTANDIELNCDELIVTGLPAFTASGGTVAACAGCSPAGGPAVLYTPPAGFAGVDTFSYTVQDPAGATDSANVQVTVLELRVPDGPANTSPGLATDVYLLPPLTQLPDFSQFTPLVTYYFGLIFFPPTTGEMFYTGQSDNVGAVFEGYLEAPTSDFYTLYLQSSDGSRLWIGDTLVVDNNGLHDVTEQSGVVGLQAGKHKVRVEYWEATGNAGVTALWKSSTLEKAVIPSFWWSWAPPALLGDLNGDQKVNGSDLGLLLSQWGGAGSADLDGSGVVDGADLGIVLAAWKP